MSEFKRFLIVLISAVTLGSLVIVGGVYVLSHNRLSSDEENAVADENHFSVRWMGFAPTYSIQYPDYYICVNNLKDTMLSMRIALQIKNQELSGFYFRIQEHQAPPAGWTIPMTTVGLIAVDQTWTGTCSANRTKPTSITAGRLDESINLAVKAYYDSAYTNLYSQDNFTVTYHFIDRTAVTWTALYNDNFDDGTIQGWASLGSSGSITASSTYYRSYPYSLYRVTGSGEGGCTKSLNVQSTYQEAYMIFSLRIPVIGPYQPTRIAFGGTVCFMPDVAPSTNIWYQYTIPLPPGATTAIQIWYGGTGPYLDDVYVIAK